MALCQLADSADRETHDGVWNQLRNWELSSYLDTMRSWVKTALMDVSKSKETRSAYFLLFDTELGPNLHGQDLYVHLANDRLNERTYEEWDKPEPVEQSKNEAFHWLGQHMTSFVNKNGYADYSIPLVFSGAALFETINTLCAERELKDAKRLWVGVGYRWGDAFNLGEIGSTKLIANVKRVA